MARVLIVAKTRMGGGYVCIGGWNIDTNESIRLLGPDGWNQPANTPYDVGQIWELDFYRRVEIIPPHVEDVIVTREKYLSRSSNLREMLLQRVPVWHGSPTNLFDGLLNFESGRAYIDKTKSIPNCSTGYWQPEASLMLARHYDKWDYQTKYLVTVGNNYYQVTLHIAYVGFAEPIQEIPANTLIRVSLARGSRKLENIKDRCYLQISGWYL